MELKMHSRKLFYKTSQPTNLKPCIPLELGRDIIIPSRLSLAEYPHTQGLWCNPFSGVECEFCEFCCKFLPVDHQQ